MGWQLLEEVVDLRVDPENGGWVGHRDIAVRVLDFQAGRP